MSNNFELTDYMGFQELLTDEEKLVRETARNFVNDKVIPIIDEPGGIQIVEDQIFGTE